MAEHLLTKQNGEFYPFGAEIDNQGKLTNIGHHDGDEFPLSQTKINELKKYFEIEITNKNIRAYAIAFDGLVKKNSTSEKTDAIVIECYSKENKQRTTYYSPYKRTEDAMDFGESWAISD
ncbi:MAG TPA: hypothetical protein VIU12_01315 [Chryseolinea sp.]